MARNAASRLREIAIILSLCAVSAGQAKVPGSPGQCASPDGTKTVDGKPCATPKTPSVSEQFPFPGEETKPSDELPSSPARIPPATGPNSVKDQFPYPSEPNAPDPVAAPKSGSGESSSSSSADLPPADADSKPALKDEGTEGSTARGRRRLRPPAQKTLSDEERVEEDLSVAHYYQQAGNLNGAYMRTKDAVKVQPQAADAHLALAEVAERLGKRDEAIAEYTRYLELEPDGDGVKAAKKGLEKLKP